MSYHDWLYGYSNPVKFKDPTGLFPCENCAHFRPDSAISRWCMANCCGWKIPKFPVYIPITLGYKPKYMSEQGKDMLFSLETGPSWYPGFHDDGRGNCTFGVGELIAKDRDCADLSGGKKGIIERQINDMSTYSELKKYAINRFHLHILPTFERAVYNAFMEVLYLSQKQFDALVVFSYAHGANEFDEYHPGKKIVEKVKIGDYEYAAAYMTSYDLEDPVLQNRNMETAILFLGGPYHVAMEAPAGCYGAECLMETYLSDKDRFMRLFRIF
ncbi:hypothetical protein DRH14_04500, partial [Candidatus Shapirobacteria bacterium]